MAKANVGAREEANRQLTLDRAWRSDGRHGGWRPGAGRPRGRGVPGHVRRPTVAGRHPIHVTLRVVAGLPSLRREPMMTAIRGAIAACRGRDDFRIVEFSVLSNHLHLLVEAADRSGMSRGVQGLAVRLAQTLNRILGRKGRLFAGRFHARVLRTPREVRGVLVYVLQNQRHHAAREGMEIAADWIDPCSSGPWFTGWREEISDASAVVGALRQQPAPTEPARTWLGTEGWRRGGLLAFDERARDQSGSRSAARVARS